MFLDTAIDELTGVTGNHAGESVWIYGEMVWGTPHIFEFIVIHEALKVRECHEKKVSITSNLVKRYRDGGTPFFLINMSSMMAHILDVEQFILSPEELERKKRTINTTVPY